MTCFQGDLDVRGILYSSVTEHSVAIFAHNNRQFSLGIGEKVPGYDATISAIFSDHIVINYQGKMHHCRCDMIIQQKGMHRTIII